MTPSGCILQTGCFEPFYGDFQGLQTKLLSPVAEVVFMQNRQFCDLFWHEIVLTLPPAHATSLQTKELLFVASPHAHAHKFISLCILYFFSLMQYF